MFDDDENFIEARELEEMGISTATIYYHTNTKRDWPSKMSERSGRNAPRKLIAVASLPRDLQLKIEKRRSTVEDRPSIVDPQSSRETALTQSLLRFPVAERTAWMSEIVRLSAIIERYAATTPKRVRSSILDPQSSYQPSPAVLALSKEAACTDQVILSREPSRATAPSQSTLDRWLAEYRQKGASCFLRTASKAERADDKRKAAMSPEAKQWANDHWRDFRGPVALYEAITPKAKKEGWTIPSLAWFTRRWKDLPPIVLVSHMHGKKAYTDRLAPYVPRTIADLEVLELLCGDHSLRDVSVLAVDGRTLVRPWLTIWQDHRSGLIWGWCLREEPPCSAAIAAAYANGVRTFGAQPPERPEDGYKSGVYHDWGKDYKGHHMDDSINVHKAERLDSGLELLLVERKVGLLHDQNLRSQQSRGYNGREKFVERTHRDISDAEQNVFDEWCGRDAKNKPDRWRDLWAQHQRFSKGKLDASPFIGIDEYRDWLAGWIRGYNTRPHVRTTLNNAKVVPIEEYRRGYLARYPGGIKINDQALALLLMKHDEREIRKLGVELFGFHYLHPAMTPWKGKKIKVEVRFDDADYTRVWVILPDGKICEAEMIERSSIKSPNKETLKRVAEQQAFEKKTMRDHSLLNFSMSRGLTTEDRVAEQLAEEEPAVVEAIAAEGGGGGGATVHRMTRMDRPKLRAVSRGLSAVEAATVAADDSIFESDSGPGRVREFDYED